MAWSRSCLVQAWKWASAVRSAGLVVSVIPVSLSFGGERWRFHCAFAHSPGQVPPLSGDVVVTDTAARLRQPPVGVSSPLSARQIGDTAPGLRDVHIAIGIR